MTIPITFDNTVTRASSTNNVPVHNHFHNTSNNISFSQVLQNNMTNSSNTGNTSSIAYGNGSGTGNVLTSGCAELDAMFDAAGRQFNINPNLLKAVAQIESNFRPDAISPAGAMGIMQIMPSTARHLGVTDPLDSLQSIMGGARYLREQLDRFNGDISLALAAYNAGWPAVERHGGIPPFPETQAYVPRVLDLFGNGDITAGLPQQTNPGFPGMNHHHCPTCAAPPAAQNNTANSINMNEILSQMASMMMLNMQMGMSNSGGRSSFF